MVLSKVAFEKEATSAGVEAKHHVTDNGAHVPQNFSVSLEEKKQSTRRSGVGAHHQNGVAENSIKNFVRMASVRRSNSGQKGKRLNRAK